MRIIAEEPRDLEHLEQLLADRTDVPRPYSVAVEAIIFDPEWHWVLMERGPGCRDEIGKLEGVGGRVSGIDADFRSALKRELSEEVGDDAYIEILRFFEVRSDTVHVPGSSSGDVRHWIIVSYICFFRSGVMQVREPLKNVGFFRVSIASIDPSRLSSSSVSALKSLHVEWPDIMQTLKSAQ